MRTNCRLDVDHHSEINSQAIKLGSKASECKILTRPKRARRIFGRSVNTTRGDTYERRLYH